MTDPKYILFDFGGTLVEPKFDRDRWIDHWLSLAHNPRNVTVEDVREVGDELLNEAYEADTRPLLVEFTRTQFERHLSARLGLSFELSNAAMELEYCRVGYHAKLAPGIFNTLKKLHELKIPMGVVSNCVLTGKTLEDVFSDLDIAQFLNFTMSSADYGFRKPHPQIFKTAIAKTDCVAEDIWFIGDRLDNDINGAQFAGMKGIWYNPEGEVAEGVRPDHQILHWDQLLDLFPV